MTEEGGRSAVREIASCAVMTAFLLAVQLALSAVSGVELVTAIFLVFCYTYGARAGVLTATAFSLLRCLMFGFFPNVVVLYLVYYNLFALIFGFAGTNRGGIAVWLCPVLLLFLAAFCVYFAVAGVRTSALYRERISVMLWVLFGIACVLAVFWGVLFAVGKERGRAGRELVSVTVLAVFCTVCFTLLDDLITPLFFGYSADAAAAYFYAGFFSMLPQTVCAAVSVFFLFPPLRKVFSAAAKRI